MPVYGYVIIAAGWILWFAPFPVVKWNFKSPEKLDRRARWGIALQVVGYSLLWQASFWTRSPSAWQMGLSVLFFAWAAILSWTGTFALGRHLRVDAGLSADHRLVRSGPYRLLRHPIYTSMLCMVLGTGFLIAPLPLLGISVLLFIAGTEVRVRVEDTLLASRFGADFELYRRTVPAYVPWLHG